MAKLSNKKLSHEELVLQKKIEEALDYVRNTYPGLCDADNEWAATTPHIFYNEGCYQLFLYDLYCFTGDKHLKWFSNPIKLPNINLEQDYISSFKYIECSHCGCTQFGDNMNKECPSCGNNLFISGLMSVLSNICLV